MNTPRLMTWLCALLLFCLIGTACQKRSVEILELSPEDKFTKIENELQRIAQSSLPDFAPSLYRSTSDIAWSLRRKLDQVGQLEDYELDHLQDQLDSFNTRAQRTKQRVGAAYPLRNKVIQLNFVRAYFAEQFCDAEQNYYLLFKLAWEDQFTAQGRRLAEITARQYEVLIDRSRQRLKMETQPVLENYYQAIASDLLAVNNINHSDSQRLDDADQVYQKLLMGNKVAVANGNSASALFDGRYPGKVPRPATKASSRISIKRRFADSIELMWQDRSMDEAGNRIYRSADGLSWELLTDVGPVRMMEDFFFTDTGLTPDTKYCYRVETYYEDGESFSSINECVYTPDVLTVPLWRLQVRIKVADLPRAELNDLLGITLGYSTAIGFQNTQYLDYGHDDFERGSHFVYDIDLGEIIREFNDLIDFQVHVRDGDILIEELSLVANEREIYFRHFGRTYSSAKKVSAGKPLAISHEELRCHPNWQAYVNSYQASGDKGLFILAPLLMYQEGNLVIGISKEHIASRLESSIGDILNIPELVQSRVKWREQHDTQVHVMKKDYHTLSVELDLTAPADGLSDQDLNIGFDLDLALAGPQSRDQVSLVLKPVNFRSNLSPAMSLDRNKANAIRIIELIKGKITGGTSPDPAFNRAFEAPSPAGFYGQTRYLRVRVDPQGNVVIGIASGA